MAGNAFTDRDAWLLADDEALLAQCDVHRYRASGPGGQHRNKTASAVRLHHRPSGLIVTATERRSQHENRRVALQRLRAAIAVQVRCPFDASGVAPPAALAGVVVDGRLTIGARDPRCRVLVGWTLDALVAFDGRMSDVARLLGLPTTRVVGLLRREPKRLAAANAIRSRFSMAPLR